jgi:hypothetical protein
MRTTTSRSSLDSVGVSPVVPHGTTKCTPPATCRSIVFRSAGSSISPDAVNGVTSAVPTPDQSRCIVYARP